MMSEGSSGGAATRGRRAAVGFILVSVWLNVPSLGVIIYAAVDALADLGVTDIDMPASPERVWRAIQAVRTARK